MNKFKLAVIATLLIGIGGSASLLASDDKPVTKEYVIDSVAIEAIGDGSISEIVITDDNGVEIEAIEAADYKEVQIPGTNDSFKYGYTVDSAGNFIYGTIYTDNPDLLPQESSDSTTHSKVPAPETGDEDSTQIVETGTPFQEETGNTSMVYHRAEEFNADLSAMYGSDITFEELDKL